MSIFKIKKGDLVPVLTATLMQAVGTAAAVPIDLTTATGVKFAMKKRGATANKVDAAATVVSAVAGTVKYPWVLGDTDTAGFYIAEFQITWPAGKQTVPGSGYDQVQIDADIAT